MLITSIVIYLLFAITMYAIAKNAVRFKLNKQDFNANFSLLIALLLFSTISGLRYRVGVDCEAYAESYMLLLGGSDISQSEFLYDVEAGFLFISKCMAKLQIPRIAYMGFWAFLEICLLTLAFRKRVALLPMIYFLLILGPYYLSFMNGIRQSVVSCAFVFAIQSLVDDRNVGKYIAIILLSCLIHKSAIILLPLFIVMFYNKRPNILLCLILLAVSTILGKMPFVREYMQMTDSIMEFVGYSRYAENMDYYIDLDSTITSFGPRQLILMLTNIFIILLSRKVCNRYKNDRLYKVSFLFFMIYACCIALLQSMDVLFFRPLLYFFPFVLICESYTLLYLIKPNKQIHFGPSKIRINDMMAKLFFMVVILIFSSYAILDNIAEMNNPNESSLFKFIFFQ